MGQQIKVFCWPFIYHGKVEFVDDTTLVLEGVGIRGLPAKKDYSAPKVWIPIHQISYFISVPRNAVMPPKVEAPADNRPLKALNSDGRTTCAKCGGNLKTPYPGICYCPVCEP